MAGSAFTCAGSFPCKIDGGYLGIFPGTSSTGIFDKVPPPHSNECATDGLAAWEKGAAMIAGTAILKWRA
jgi:hypothetical protein